MSSQLNSRGSGHRSDRRLLLVTGAAAGAAGAFLLPLLWVGALAIISGLGPAGVGEGLLITLLYAVPAAVIFAVLGLLSGFTSSLIWGARSRGGAHRARVLAALTAGLTVGIPAAVGILILFESALTALALGAFSALVAAAAVAVTIGRLRAREEQTSVQDALLGM